MNRMVRMLGLVFVASAAFGAARAAEYDLAAYVWPAYQPEPRWAELGIFAEGIGEWQNVKEAVPKWKEHNQPRKPLWGYANEADPKEVARKIDAAVSAGINVFAYDWYWYGGRPFLEDALNEGFLKAPNSGKMRFYLMWANHHVTKLWDNRVAEKGWDKPIWSGCVSPDEFKVLTKRWIERYFTKPNYYRIEGKPVLMVYVIKNLIDGLGGLEGAKASLDYLREECRKAGLGGVHLMACDNHKLKADELKALGFESATMYCFGHWSSATGDPDYDVWGAKGVERFDKAVRELGLKAYFAHASIGWDTNPRFPKEKTMPTVLNSNPTKFERVLRKAKAWTDAHTPAGCPKLITLYSWNEWTEGAYFEPDETFRYGYLDAVRRVFGGAAE